MGQLSAAAHLSLFQKANLRTKHYVWASINFTENIVLCLENRQSKTYRQANGMPENLGTTEHWKSPPLPPLVATLPSPPLDPDSGD